MPRTRILVVDDDRTTLQVTRAHLEAAGYDVVTRDQALGTSALVLRERPDVVLLDVDMPGLRGDNLAELMAKNAAAHSPALVLHSSIPAASLKEIARRCGAFAYVEKTGSGAELVAAVNSIVRRLGKRPGVATPSAQLRAIRGEVLDSRVVAELLALERPGKQSFVAELREVFLREASEQVAALERALGESQAEPLRISAHKLRGSSKNLGAFALAAACESIERHAQANNLAAARTVIPTLRAELDRAKLALERLVTDRTVQR